MKTENRILYLVRHAKAIKLMNGMQDVDRPLHEDGIIESYEIANQLFITNEIPQLIISSSAARAISTAVIFQRVLNIPDEQVKIIGKLYEIHLNDLYELVVDLDDKFQSIMLVGHNPAFTMLANKLEPTVFHMPTASVAKFEFEVTKWRHSSYINARKELFIYP